MNSELATFLKAFQQLHPLTIPSNIVEMVERDIELGRLQEPHVEAYAEVQGVFVIDSVSRTEFEHRTANMKHWMEQEAEEDEGFEAMLFEEWVTVLQEHCDNREDHGFVLDELAENYGWREYDYEDVEER